MEKSCKLLWENVLHLASMAAVRMDILLLMKKIQGTESNLTEKS